MSPTDLEARIYPSVCVEVKGMKRTCLNWHLGNGIDGNSAFWWVAFEIVEKLSPHATGRYRVMVQNLWTHEEVSYIWYALFARMLLRFAVCPPPLLSASPRSIRDKCTLSKVRSSTLVDFARGWHVLTPLSKPANA